MGKKTDVLILCCWDSANTAYRTAECLKSLGLTVKAYKGFPHKFDYPEQLPLHPGLGRRPLSLFPMVTIAPELKEDMENAEVVHFTHSTFVDAGIDIGKAVVQHGGSTYRLDPEASNRVFNQFVSFTVAQFPAVMNKGAIQEKLVYNSVDTDFIQPFFNAGRKPVFGHFPSSPQNKGTEVIKAVMDKFDVEFICDTQTLPWEQSLERMRQCDVIIETLKPTLRDLPFGEWGNTSLEAAALGKIVITNCHSKELYQREYGDLPLHIANNSDELRDTVVNLLSMDSQEILHEKQDFRDWVETYHSIDATAERWWDQVYRDLIDA